MLRTGPRAEQTQEMQSEVKKTPQWKKRLLHLLSGRPKSYLGSVASSESVQIQVEARFPFSSKGSCDGLLRGLQAYRHAKDNENLTHG